MKGRIKKKGDFIRLLAGTMEVGKIISIDENKNSKQVQIELLNSNDKSFYDKTEILPIHTKEHHLQKLGFEKIYINKRLFYNILNIYIVREGGSSYLIDTHVFIDENLSSDTINLNISQGKYLNVNNINDVFTYLRKNNLLSDDPKKVILSSNLNY